MTERPYTEDDPRTGVINEPLGSVEYGAALRQRVIAAMTEEAQQHRLFEREQGPTARALAIQHLATAAIGVLYPQLQAWKEAGAGQPPR
ncbi:hypothetical protein [Streptomyces uncialis]|uniref:hypothetical protein n=1 Tax=Streptomyces uncialis TaxID=1048205 RepID=UPI00340A7552